MAHEKRTCRWAALSLSSIAEVFLKDILPDREGHDAIKHKLVAVSSTKSKDQAHKWLAAIDGLNPDAVAIYANEREMLEHADFDVVYISTPHPLHYRNVTTALEWRRNVLVEKPATMNAAQFQKLSTLAEEKGVVLMEAMWTRYLPATTFLADELLPLIGEVRRVYADFSFPIVSPDLPHSSRFLNKAAGAGSLLDQGVYALTWADIGLHGGSCDGGGTKVAFANSMSVPDVPGDVDDIDTLVLVKPGQSAQKAVAIVTTSMTLPGSSTPAFYQRLQAAKSAPSVRIEATKASVAIPFPPIRPQELHVQWYDEAHLDENGMETQQTFSKPMTSGWGMWYQADVIAARVFSRAAGAAGDVIGGEQSLRVLKWMDQARELSGVSYAAELDQL